MAALGLAFGGATATPEGPALLGAYRLVMLAAAILAALSALVAALTIGRKRASHRTARES